MKELLDKLSSYNVFNYLLPGVLFATFVDGLTSFRILQKDIAVGVFVYYFLGSVVSRVGSLFIEPVLRKVGIVKFAPYADFVRVSKTDPKLDVLSEANNMYRTFCSLMICVGVVSLYDRASSSWPALQKAAPTVLIAGLFFLYLLSYKKQTAYISKRIEASTTQDGKL
ncbi:hypothetical protein PWG14_17835 (plasmid) [Chromobacterium amazonense]|uniref:hypothetical protein n=1 Tax=Chromobacterium amazonense TaxID=1382803 RepID=UPI00237D4AFC|nr:hypothetical protein [Chromobacterium amazonense]MDE1714376.1 hypothetical protein [Chromobacterium amazonense]